MTEPLIAVVATPEAPAAPAAPVSTDEYIQKRNEEKREKRGGVQVRIDKLTREASRAKQEAEEVKAKLAAIEQQTVAPAPVVAEPVQPDLRPKRDAFADESAYTVAVAEWVVRQQNKIVSAAAAKPAPPAQPAEVQFDAQNPAHQQLKQEFDGFMQAGHEFRQRNPDFVERLNKAAEKGLTLNNEAQRAIIRLQAPAVLYWLAAPENEQHARSLMGMDANRQVIEVSRLAERLEVKPTDYVSNAPRPGQHIATGNTRATIPRDKMEPDDYIAMRREERRKKFRH